MLITKKVDLLLRNNNKKFYKDLGYDIEKSNITVNIQDLNKNSTIKVEAKCDMCDKIKTISYCTYIKNTNNNSVYYSCSIKCSSEKRKKTNKNKYGVEYPSQLESIKNKIKDTNLEKYGHVCSLHSDEIDKKVKSNNLEKYGHEYALQSEEIREKSKKTSLERYGVDNPMKLESVQNKAKDTNLEKYGVEYVLQSDLIKDKIKTTNLEKYGSTHPMQSKIIRDKQTKTRNSETIKKYNLFLSSDYEKIDLYDDFIFKIKHKKCNNVFDIHLKIAYSRINTNKTLCTICNPINDHSSNIETQLCYFLDSLNIDYISNDRAILNGKELDIYIPSLNLAIEFNGLYWHSELYKDKNYHLNKTIECQKKGIQLIHIFEDEWNYKQDIVKSIIKNKLGKIVNKIYARKTEVREVKSNIARIFLDENHIQGFSKSTYKLGLYYNNELISLMTFGYRKTNSKKEFELIRFCNKLNWNVIGASSKLFKYFIKNYKDKIEELYILSYADISLFDGNMYNTLGFKEIHLTKPNYFWVVNGIREHRFKYNKQKLIKEGYDASKTEVEIMHERGYYRIYGSGQKRYEYYFK